MPKRRPHPRIFKIATYNPHFHGHYLRVDSPQQLDRQVQKWLRESYRVGQQKALPLRKK